MAFYAVSVSGVTSGAQAADLDVHHSSVGR